VSKRPASSPPAGASPAGCALWRSVLIEYELDEHELVLLVEAVRTVSALDELDAVARRDGLLIESSQGLRAHPAVTEARQLRIALARILAALRLPAGDAGEVRPQRRSGVRRPYKLHGLPS
jgi:hypothetical protein